MSHPLFFFASAYRVASSSTVGCCLTARFAPGPAAPPLAVLERAPSFRDRFALLRASSTFRAKTKDLMTQSICRTIARFAFLFGATGTAFVPACGPTSNPASPPTETPDAGEVAEAGDGAPVAGTPAFPGAVGWAARTAGGRGGALLRVTTLDLSGPGSLADALGRSG